MATLNLNSIYKKWGDVTAVEDANIAIKDQEFIVILGPSGCGKTTTMRMVAGLEEPSEGEIMIDDKIVNDLEPKDRDIAMVFQNYGLYPHLKVYDNICFPLKVRKVDKATHQERVLKAAKMVELEDLLERKPKELSGGQRQRVALARAIVREPKIFLMDEPLSNLDAKLRVSTRAQLKNLQHELKITTIYVTHDQIEAMTLADRVVVMNKGKIQQIASPKEIYNAPENIFVAGFIGSPPMNIIEGEVTQGFFQTEKGAVPVNNVPDGKVYLGFRAEDIEIVDEPAQADLKADIYSIEYLGDSTLVTVQIHHQFVLFKASKEYKAQIGDRICVKIAQERCHFFDNQSGQRLHL